MANYKNVASQGRSSVTFKDTMNYTQEQSRFTLPFLTNTTGDFGMLIPVHISDLIPGDDVTIRAEMVQRLGPMVKPTMHPINTVLWAFKVSQRIIWKDWATFITGGNTGDTAIPKPMVSDIIETWEARIARPLNTTELDLYFGEESLWDYCGLPIVGQDGITTRDHIYNISKEVDALPFMAIYEIWYEKIRDQNLQDFDKYDRTNDAFEVEQYLTLKACCLDKDFETTARPWQLIGTPPAIPLGGIAPLKLGSLPNPIDLAVNDQVRFFNESSGIWSTVNTADGVAIVNDGTTIANPGFALAGPGGPSQGNSAGLTVAGLEGFHKERLLVDLNEAVGNAFTQAQLREVTGATHRLERITRGGNRLVDMYQINWGVTLPDATAQRPIYIGGTGFPLIISEVLQTAPDVEAGASTTGVGKLMGHGIGSGSGTLGSTYADEHGILIILALTMPRKILFQGIPKLWDKKTLYDYQWPDFVNLSEQAIKNKEIYVGTRDTATLNQIWGYQENYGHWKTGRNQVTGKMKTSLKNWQIPQIITPGQNDTLSEAHIVWDGRLTEKKGIFAVPTEPSFQLSVGVELDIYRALPFITIPGQETL